jgi:hypothetical protein
VSEALNRVAAEHPYLLIFGLWILLDKVVGEIAKAIATRTVKISFKKEDEEDED